MSGRNPFRKAAPLNGAPKIPVDRRQFFEAARYSHVHMLRKYLAQDEDIVNWKLDGKTALLIAAESRQFMSVQELLKAGADPALLQGSDPSMFHGAAGTTPLHAAAKVNDAPIIGLLLHHRAPVDVKRGNDNTPLMDAIFCDSREAAASLLALGASTAKMNGDGEMPLHIAAERNYPECAALLLGHGAEIDARSKQGWTALMVAADNGRLETCALLLSRGCDPHLKNPDGKTALDLGLAHGDNDPEFVEEFRRLVMARFRNDAPAMAVPFTEGSEQPVSVRKPLKLRRPAHKPRTR